MRLRSYVNIAYSYFSIISKIIILLSSNFQQNCICVLYNFKNNFQKVSFNFRPFITIIRVWGFSFIKRLILGFLTWKFNTLSDVLCTIFLKMKILVTQNSLEFREAITDNYTEASIRIVFYRMQSLHSNWI